MQANLEEVRTQGSGARGTEERGRGLKLGHRLAQTWGALCREPRRMASQEGSQGWRDTVRLTLKSPMFLYVQNVLSRGCHHELPPGEGTWYLGDRRARGIGYIWNLNHANVLQSTNKFIPFFKSDPSGGNMKKGPGSSEGSSREIERVPQKGKDSQ